MIGADIYVSGTEPDYSAMVAAYATTEAMDALGSTNISRGEVQTRRKRVRVVFHIYV